MTAQARFGVTEKSIPCISRQPILTPEENVIGYELFFRESQFQNRNTTDAEQEAASTIDMLNLVGLGVLCDGRLAFINCTHNMLLSDYLALLPPSEVVVELQNDIPANEKIIQKCQHLKKSGYSIALDNFVPNDPREALIPYARFLKIDITRVSAEESALLARLHATEECRLLAQQVETRERFLAAKKSGFTRFEATFSGFPKIFVPVKFLRARPRTFDC